MIDKQGICLTQREYSRLMSELRALRSRRSIEVPDDSMDVREIEDLPARAIVTDTPEITAEPGMVLTIRYEDSGETETFLLGRYGAEDADITVYSTLSRLGRAIAGARPGERRIYPISDGASPVVTLISAEPYVSESVA